MPRRELRVSLSSDESLDDLLKTVEHLLHFTYPDVKATRYKTPLVNTSGRESPQRRGRGEAPPTVLDRWEAQTLEK
jgi:hypothetical protein